MNPGKEFYIRELAQKTGCALRAVHQEVENLLKAGVLKGRRSGNRLYVKADDDNPVFAELQALIRKTAGLADILRGVMDGKKGIEVAFVFGSIAEGMENAISDIDLFIVGSISPLDLTKMLKRTEEELGREINPHIFTRAELKSRIEEKEHFLTSVMKGQKLFIAGDVNELTRLAEGRLAKTSQDFTGRDRKPL